MAKSGSYFMFTVFLSILILNYLTSHCGNFKAKTWRKKLPIIALKKENSVQSRLEKRHDTLSWICSNQGKEEMERRKVVQKLTTGMKERMNTCTLLNICIKSLDSIQMTYSRQSCTVLWEEWRQAGSIFNRTASMLPMIISQLTVYA